jgi:hypothetical protein
VRKREKKKEFKKERYDLQTSKIHTKAQRHLRTQHAQLCEHTQLRENNARGRRWERKFPFIKKIGFFGSGCCHVMPPTNPNFFT